MGNMIFNRRLGTSGEEGEEEAGEYRVFKQHMYGGPRGLGDPTYRGMSKMEEDPMIPQRMRDITRTQLCTGPVSEFAECAQTRGFTMVLHCRDLKDAMVQCQKSWMERPEFVAAVTEEYLNERSHYRQTGIKQKRYDRGKFIARDPSDPSLDQEGNYRPQKPKGWDESYPEGPPGWATFQYWGARGAWVAGGGLKCAMP